MVLEARYVCDDDCPALPHEVVLARLNGLPGEPGYIPWAAFESHTIGPACAWIRLCDWQTGMNSVIMGDPEALGLDEASSRTLLATMQPYFAEDGIALAYWQPGCWLATGEVFRGLRTVSLDRVVGQAVGDWQLLGGTPQESSLRRLQSEMQMLLYTLPLNQQRETLGLPPVSAFWVTGAGALAHELPVASQVQVESRLALAGPDPTAHAQAWQATDENAIAQLLARQRQGETVRLTLCSDHAAHTWRSAGPRNWWQKIQHAWRSAPSSAMWETL